jgi:acyl-CoA synthetase (AMP-forming)/AMP-acid ligase II
MPGLPLAAMIERHGRTRPGHPAIIHGDRTLGHAEFAAAVLAMAGRLADLGVAPGTAVGVGLGTRPEHLAALFALAHLAAIAVPIDKQWAAPEKDQVAAAFGASFILVDPDDTSPPARVRSVAVGADWSEPSGTAPPAAEDLDLPYMLALSSGTTASPTGPLLTQRHLLHRFAAQWVTLTFNGRDRFLPATPLYFGASRAFCLSTLYAGATVVLMDPPYDAARLPGLVERHGATAAFLVPTLLRRLLDLPAHATQAMRRLRVLVSSGAALHQKDAAAIRQRLCPNLFNYYGTTEGGGIAILGPEEAAAHAGSVGRALFGVEIAIADQSGAPLPAGAEGRIRYRGPGVAGADGDGWFYSGDLGRLDVDGYLTLLGRDKDLIVRGGANIYPAEIEAVIGAVEGVEDVAVVGWPSPEFGEEIAAFVAGPGVTEDAILGACRAALARYKIPRRVFTLDVLPRNSSGKVLKQELRRTLPPL